MKNQTNIRSLTPNETRRRVASLLVLPVGVLVLTLVPPDSLPRWLPLYPSCGAITGLPCIFCGTTRALHCLLHGNFARALYYNWLAFPFAAAALALLVLDVVELCYGRKLVVRPARIQVTRARCFGALVVLLLLWSLQIYLAVTQHKTELLNPNGPLYSLVVR